MGNKPILICGVHRSGTTWLANMLSVMDQCTLVEEPFNAEPWSYRLNGLATKWYTYAPLLDQEKAKKAYNVILTKNHRKLFPKKSFKYWLPWLRGKRAIIKDPLSSASLRWILDNFDVEPIVLLRHPCAIVNSLKRKNWVFPFEDLIAQPQLIEEHLPFFYEEFKNINVDDIVENGAFCWKCINTILSKYYTEDSSITVVRHEDLSREPLVEFNKLYDAVGLEWNDEVAQAIESFTGESNPVNAPKNKTHHLKRDSKHLIDAWKAYMKEEDINRIKEISSPLLGQFGYK